MKIGFTGTRKSMTKKQKSIVSYHLWVHTCHISGEAHHGDYIGADAEFHRMAMRLGLKVFKHPAIAGIPHPRSDQRAYCEGGTELEAKDALVRNRDIVDAVDIMIAAPAQRWDVLRSGTWMTIRYAKRIGKQLVIVYPDGTSTPQMPQKKGGTER